MPKKKRAQVGLMEILDRGLAAAEDAAAQVVCGIADRVEGEIAKSAEKFVSQISSKTAPKTTIDDDGAESEFGTCQCEGVVCFSPEGVCTECGKKEPR